QTLSIEGQQQKGTTPSQNCQQSRRSQPQEPSYTCNCTLGYKAVSSVYTKFSALRLWTLASVPLAIL
uniref:Uncharacterized protein n=1 Tax=Romanomermis culicivorax TaxID=13658 RepID=A0A915J6Z1_ROMCU